MTVETFDLSAHPAYPPMRVRSVSARVLSLDPTWCVLRWKVDGAAQVIVSPFAGRARSDALWQTTCFELFIRANGALEQAYSEFNFAPSERWAAYDFTTYRTGMAPRSMPRPPVITPRFGADVLFCDVAIPAECLPSQPWCYGLTAVIEEEGAHRSFWAMSHPRDVPDFHDPACHGAWLAAPLAT